MLYNSEETKLIRALRRQIGQNIHNARSRQKLTLRKLSKYTGLSPEMLDKYEVGKEEIDLREIVKISLVLKVNIDQLLSLSA